MQVEFSKDQFEKLLELLYLGERTANSHALEGDQLSEHKKYSEILGYVTSFAKDFGLPKLANEEEGRIFPSKFVEEKMQKFIDSYEEESFWEQLSSRLAIRDMHNLYSPKVLEKMNPEECYEKEQELEEEWIAEFEESGLNRLEIVKKGRN